MKPKLYESYTHFCWRLFLPVPSLHFPPRLQRLLTKVFI